MRIQRFRTASILSITLMAFGLATAAQAYADDTQYAREHRREEQRHAREHRREAQRHQDQGYYGNQQGYGNRGNEPYYRDPYSRNRTEAYTYGGGTYGSGRSGDVINRALSNLNVAAMNSRVDGHERGHFNTAQQELTNFQARWAQGQFDTGRLDKAVSAMQDLVNSDQISPRDRSVLSNDVAALRQFRNSGGQGAYSNPSYRNNPYGYRIP